MAGGVNCAEQILSSSAWPKSKVESDVNRSVQKEHTRFMSARASVFMDNSRINAAILSSKSCADLHSIALQHLRPQPGDGCGMNLVNCATLLHRLAKTGNVDRIGPSCISLAIAYTSKLLAPAATASAPPAARTL